MRARYSILLGGIGGDCHSVGLTILRHSLLAHEYDVQYLGTQNRLEDFFAMASLFNVVMISSLDGHGRYYLAEFPRFFAQQRPAADRPLWYVGGNLCIGDATATIRALREMRFDRVFPKFTDIVTVLDLLARDLQDVTPRPGPALVGERRPSAGLTAAAIDDGRMDPDTLGRQRREVLDHWKTGWQAAALDENATFLARQPSFPLAQQAVLLGAAPMLVQPRSGVALIDRQIALFRALASAGARVLSYQVDSLTRVNDYAGADQAIRDSQGARVSALNGFPVVSHGVPGLRRVITEIGVPLQTRHSTRDPRLLAELSYAGGVTAFEGGAICYNVPYYKDYPLAESIPRWQYVDRLTGLYHDRFGIVLDREFFGTLTGTLVPPSLAIATNLLEMVLAVRQGVRCVSLGYAEQGHRAQDIAAIRTMRRMASELLQRLGHTQVQVNTVFHQYMAAFPSSRARAEQLIYESAITAALSGATRVLTKTPAEAISIPTLEDNVLAMHLVNGGLAAAALQPVDDVEVESEAALIAREAWSLVDHVVMSGGGSLARGIVEALRKGYLDIPFAPSIHNAGAVLTARDTSGAVRYLSLGALPFDADLRDLHREKMDERRRAEGIVNAAHSYQLVEQDVMQIARERYAGWPLSSPRDVSPLLRPALPVAERTPADLRGTVEA